MFFKGENDKYFSKESFRVFIGWVIVLIVFFLGVFIRVIFFLFLVEKVIIRLVKSMDSLCLVFVEGEIFIFGFGIWSLEFLY